MTDTIELSVTPGDQAANPYYYVPVTVPEGTTRIDITMTYPKTEDCIVDLGILDPTATDYPSASGFRGWSGGARDRFFVATDDATPGYVHGPMPAGTWRIILGLYKVPPQGARVTLTVATDASPRKTLPPPARTYPVRAKAGWYKGDLHCHTYHSDAGGSPELLHAAAKQAGLDFLAIADHNTTTQRRYFHPQSSPDLVFVRAIEITTATGHANVYGVDEWIDFRMTKPSDAQVLERLVHERGGLLSVNHDKPTIPWDYELPRIDCMEVWQSTWMAWNWVSLARYQQRLASGLHISAIGGSDYHQPDRLMPEGPLVLARPTTMLDLPELSEDAVLDAMRAGRGYVTESPTGPHLAISAGGKPMGSTVSRDARAEAHVRGAAGDRIDWYAATGKIAEATIEGDDWRGTLPLEHASGFVRAEIVAVASRGRLVADFTAALDEPELPWQLEGSDLTEQPIRRAISNPLYLEA